MEKNQDSNKNQRIDIQWYPGHMTKAKRSMQEDIKLIDIVIELLDARVPFSSKNPDIDELARNKFRLLVLNKADLADEKMTAEWESFYKEKGYAVTKMDSRNTKALSSVTGIVKEVCKEKTERDRKRGILNRPIRAMIVGIPNVGKSTFINSYARKACTRVGNKPGVTKGKQWIRISKEIELLDTPGILWPKFEDWQVGVRLAMIGSVNDDILSKTEIAFQMIDYFQNNYCNILTDRYTINGYLTGIETLTAIAEKRQCRLKGNEPDIEKAASILLDDFRAGRLGRITLERPE